MESNTPPHHSRQESWNTEFNTTTEGLKNDHLELKKDIAQKRGTVRCWRSKPDAEMEHSRLFPLCKYVLDKNVGNVPLMSSTFSLTKVIRSNNTEPVHVNFVMHRQRMESFMNWPRDKKIPKAVDLAEAGFLRPAKTLELHDLVQCFQCGISLEKWTEDDIPWNQHALWNHIVHNMNYTECRRYLIYIEPVFEHETLFMCVGSTIKTFMFILMFYGIIILTNIFDSSTSKIWIWISGHRIQNLLLLPPDCITANFLFSGILISTGFVIVANMGTVRCWRSKPDAEMEHSRLFPLCKYVLDKNVGNVPLMSSTFSLTKVIRSNNTEPVHVNFVMHRQRMESFMNWPRDKKIPKAVDLAEAGFLRPAKTLELHDLVQCFQCGISLEKWTEDDIPWNQHALWNPYFVS
nr:baculoviral IAP repeat-containing protein 2-like [Penaeus vannamei]